jgi:NitT/TauT family transport system ATP-binding protein
VIPALELRAVSAGYADGDVLRGVDIAIAQGEFVALVGRSGSGKTTLLRVAAGLHAPRSGTVVVQGAPPREAQRRKALGLVFQDSALHPWLDVLENVALPLRVNGGSSRALDLATEWTARVGLMDASRAYPYQLSGGMRQRVALARALVYGPEILLMDEPLASLDELTREDMRNEIVGLWAASGSAVLYVTHDLAEAVALADRVVVLAGRPARVTGTVHVSVPRPRDHHIRRGEAFLDAVDAVRGLLS